MSQDKYVAILEIENCMDCPFHAVLPDPDPHDSFCSDDVKVVCNKANHKPITVACRPHRTRYECAVPHWCPIAKGPYDDRDD